MADRKKKQPANQASRWEYVLGAIGAVLVAATMVYLAFDAKNDPRTPPDLIVTATRVVPGSATYVVEVSVENRGSETAAAVLIRGELRQGDAVVEDAEATLDYVPGHSTRHAGLVFTRNPAQFQMELRAIGYDVP